MSLIVDYRREQLVSKESIRTEASALPTASWVRPQTEYEFVAFLFQNAIIQLSEDMDNGLQIGNKIIKSVEEIAEQSILYNLLDGISTKQIPLEMDVLLLAILELNQYATEVLTKDLHGEKKKEDLINAIEQCVKRLIKNGLWSTEDTKRFYIDLSLLHDEMYPNEEETAVNLLISKLHSDAYLSDEIQPFIDAIVTESQLEPIEKILEKKSTDNEKFDAIVKVAVKFITEAEKDSYDLMMANTFVGWAKRRGASMLKPKLVKGADLFQRNTRATASVFLRALRKKRLKCFDTKYRLAAIHAELAQNEIARAEKSEKKEKIRESLKKSEGEKGVATEIIEKEIMVSGQLHTVSLAVQKTDTKKIVKAITISKHHPHHDDDLFDDESSSASVDQDVYLFVQQVENPEDAPDPSIPVAALPLFKIQLSANSNSICLKQASHELHDAIVKLIPSNEYDCRVDTAIMFEKQLMLVEIIGHIGRMLSVRGLLGAIKTRMAQLDPENHDLTQLEAILTAAYVQPVNRYLSTFWQDTLFDKAFVPSHRVAKKVEEPSMKKLTDTVVKIIEEMGEKKKKPPYRWLFKAICATFYQDPDKIESEGPLTVQAAKGLRLQESFHLLKRAMIEEVQIKQAYESRQKQITTSVDIIMKGILTALAKDKKGDTLATWLEKDLNFADLPKITIQKILDMNIVPEQKADKIFLSLFAMDTAAAKSEAEKAISASSIKAGSDKIASGHGAPKLPLDARLKFLKEAFRDAGVVELQTKQSVIATQKVMITWVDTIVKGIFTTFSTDKKGKALGYLEKDLNFADFPKLKILDVLDKNISQEQKAVKIFQLLFEMATLELKSVATPEQTKRIKQFLTPSRDKTGK